MVLVGWWCVEIRAMWDVCCYGTWWVGGVLRCVLLWYMVGWWCVEMCAAMVHGGLVVC